MIISNSKKFIIQRVPKTGSTTLESSIRMAPGVVDVDAIASPVEDAGLNAINIPVKLEAQVVMRQNAMTEMMQRRRKAHYIETAKDIALKEAPSPGLVHASINDLFMDPLVDHNLVTGDIADYTIYGVIREPLERVLSSWTYAKLSMAPVHPSIEQFHEAVLNDKLDGLLFRPQYDYFNVNGEEVVTPILFTNYNAGVSNVISGLGGTPLTDYPRFKGTIAVRNRYLTEKPTVADWIDSNPLVKAALEVKYAEDITYYNKVVAAQ